jgi:hypothetical protein
LITWLEAWGRRSILGAHVKIARAEHYGGEMADGIPSERSASREAHLHGTASWAMHSVQTRRQRGGVVGDDQVTVVQEVNQVNARSMVDVPVCVDNQ